jgi:aspartyl-tRNA(Asn)/glutamyl-tRNA(Gln) amidotransferase subunit A
MHTIHEATQRIRTGQLTPTELVGDCLARIEKLDSEIHAWVCVDAKGALRCAAERTDQAARGEWMGPLHGIPVGIKDIIDVGGWPTKAGSPLRADHVATEDATLVRSLRCSGAIILGKTVTTEFASFDPPPTRNPWNTGATPGGSSSGSAAAVATGMCLAAIGTQTGGSITRPASYCGIAGCKPTFGLVSLEGIVPFAHHLDHPGPMTRCVRDLATMLNVIASDRAVDFAADLEDQRAAPRVGILEDFFLEECDAAVTESISVARERLQAAGSELHVVGLPDLFIDVLEQHRRIMEVEGAEYHRDCFLRQPDQYSPAITSLIEAGLSCQGVDYAAALAHQRAFKRQMASCLEGFDALLTPAAPSAAPQRLDTTGDPKFNSPWTHAGLPTVSIPCGLTAEGMPTALQLVGSAHHESQLLATALWCEKVLGFKEAPPGGEPV